MNTPRATPIGEQPVDAGSADSAAPTPPPLAASLDAVLADFATLPGAEPIAKFNGAQLLLERILCSGARWRDGCSPSGACRFLATADGALAVNLPRHSDWELLPAWLETHSHLVWTWPRLAGALRGRATQSLLERARLLGLAVAATGNTRHGYPHRDIHHPYMHPSMGHPLPSMEHPPSERAHPLLQKEPERPFVGHPPPSMGHLASEKASEKEHPPFMGHPPSEKGHPEKGHPPRTSKGHRHETAKGHRHETAKGHPPRQQGDSRRSMRERPPFVVDGDPLDVCGDLRCGPRPPLVVDLSALWAGPLCGNLLWLCGARVVKVESVDRPDGTRFGNADFYGLLNQGKRSLALDLERREGRAALYRLLERADIVIESSRPRALRQLGVEAGEWVGRAAGRTWISITGYGRSGAAANWVAFGDDAGVAAGLGDLMRAAVGTLQFAGDAIADPLTGVQAARAAWLSWLSGGSRLISLSLADVAARMLVCEVDELGGEGRLAQSVRHWWRATRCGGATAGIARRTTCAPVSSLGADTEALLRELSTPR